MWPSRLSSKLFVVVVFTFAFLLSILTQAQAANTSAAQALADDSGAPVKAPAVPKEDWNTLANPPGIKIGDPLAPLRSDFPTYTREFLQLMWRPTDIVDLYVLKPKGVEKPPVMLYLYSFPSDTERFQTNDFGELVTRNGYAAVGFVSALTGPRYHDRPGKEWFVSELQESMATSVHDVQFVIDYLAKRGDLDMSRVGMFGGGSGASIAIMAAAVDPRIKVLDLVGPWGDWPDWLAKSPLVPNDERGQYVKPEFLKRVENVDPLKWLPTLTTQKIRLQYLKDDEITPAVVREHIMSAAPRDAQIVQYDSEQKYIEAMGGESADKMFDWAKSQLAPIGREQKTTAKDSSQPSPLRRN